MDKKILAITKPKKIDLSKYGLNETDNISYAILLMFSQGGGSCHVSNKGELMEPNDKGGGAV